MSIHDPEILDVLIPAAEGDPRLEACLRAAHFERSTALDRYRADDIDGAHQHLLAAWAAVDEVLAEWYQQGRKEINGDVVEFGAVLREDMALVKFRLRAPFEEVVELLEFARGVHERLNPGGEGVVRCLSALADAHAEVGDMEASRRYTQQALELGGAGG